MKFFVYFDAYGHAREAVSEKELAERYNSDPDEFLRAVCNPRADAKHEHVSGHVGTLTFRNEEELNEYLRSLGDEITGFYGCESEARPYNF